jgi:hypothetical protein
MNEKLKYPDIQEQVFQDSKFVCQFNWKELMTVEKISINSKFIYCYLLLLLEVYGKEFNLKKKSIVCFQYYWQLFYLLKYLNEHEFLIENLFPVSKLELKLLTKKCTAGFFAPKCVRFFDS